MASGGGGFNPKVADNNNLESSHHYFSGILVKTMILFVMVAVVCLVINQSTNPAQFIQTSSSFTLTGPKDGSTPPGYPSLPSIANTVEDKFPSLSTESSQNVHSPANYEHLDATLYNATMEDKKTVIITTLNAAWTEPNSLFDLFMESFRIGNQTERLLNHLVVVALDQKAYSRCLEVHRHCYPLTTKGIDFSGEAHYMSTDYLKMMWRRTDFLRSVLELGYNFVFTDADIMWLRDPFPRFYPDADFQIACDQYWFNSTNMNNSPNGGFKYVKANNRTIQFYKYWNAGKYYFPGKNEQDVLNIIKFNPFIQEIGLEMRFLDTAYFGGFCEPSKDLNLVITMHANCCIGMENKIHDIKMVIDDWKKYMALPAGRRNLRARSWTVPRICG